MPGSSPAVNSLLWNDHQPRHVEIVPLGWVEEIAVSVAAANIQTFSGLRADVQPALPDPDYALVPARRQYDAMPILKALATDLTMPTLRLGLLNGDLCLPILSYVFGEAQVDGQTAVVSLHRLKIDQNGQPASTSLWLERLAKVTVHEIAHVLGLRHCSRPLCLMAFSQGLKQIDELALQFCPDCNRTLNRRVRVAPPMRP